ncbi:transposable element Tcb2 transposase [Trichonephila clavipes]|nr:transposable element Tcb2 transposase [Trichonephila clavipes]
MRLAEEHLLSQCPITCAATNTLSPSPPFEVMPRSKDWSATEWNQDVFDHDFSFNLDRYDNSVRVWRTRGERLNPAFAVQRLTAPITGVMVWGAITYDTRSPLILIHGTMVA